MLQRWLHNSVFQVSAALVAGAGVICQAALSTSYAANEATVTRATLEMRGAATCFHLESRGRIGPEVYVVENPRRVVIDAQGVNFDLPRQLTERSRGLVSDFRYGRLGNGIARIVLDVAPGVRVGRISASAMASGQRHLSVSLVSKEQQTDENVCAPNLTSKEVAAAKSTWGTNVAVNAAPRPLGKPDTSNDKVAKPETRPVVMIDPGHGGIDPGATVNNRDREKSLVLAVGRELEKRLQATGRVRVAMTRRTDKFVSLDDRIELARAAGAKLFLSLHADSLDNPMVAIKTSGAAVYILSHRASTVEARRFAEKENAADIVAGIAPKASGAAGGVRNILVDLLQRETERESERFRSILVSELRRRVPVSRNPNRAAAFRVLKQTETPAALIELGYMTNPGDMKRMRSAAWRERVSDAITAAVLRFFLAK